MLSAMYASFIFDAAISLMLLSSSPPAAFVAAAFHFARAAIAAEA
jgi:hypothetical protein